MHVILVLESGRRTLFAGDALSALREFEQAHRLAPEDETVQAWITKVRSQLAEEWLDVAQNLLSISEFEDSAAAFEKVLEYDPGHPTASEGLYRIIVRLQYREGLGLRYYRDALDDLRNERLFPASRHIDLTRTYYPDHPRAGEREDEIRQRLAEERMARAQELERMASFHAARYEYRLVLLLAPESVEASEGMNRMDREVRALDALGEADMHIRRGDLKEARVRLEQARLATELQKDAVSLLEAQIEDVHQRAMYNAAISLYKDQLFLQAVEAFDLLLAETEYYEDAISRRDTLMEFIRDAEELYAKAEQTEDPSEQLDFFRQIAIVWPEYRDIRERMKALEAEVGTPEIGEPATSGEG